MADFYNEAETSEDDTIAGKKHAPKNLGNVLILGLGKTGRAVAEYCTNLIGQRVKSVTIYGGVKNDDAVEFAERMRERGADVVFDSQGVQGTFDVCIASPGISQLSEFYKNAQAHSAEVISEIEFAWRESAKDSFWVAITGTNGKTTTTALTVHILKSTGVSAREVGNIGSVALEAVKKDNATLVALDFDDDVPEAVTADNCADALEAVDDDMRAIASLSDPSATCHGAVADLRAPHVYVAEVSSYQLASTRYFKPNVAVLLNITPDHLHWHGTLAEYECAKLRVFANMDAGDVAVLDATDDVVRKTVRAFKAMGDGVRDFETNADSGQASKALADGARAFSATRANKRNFEYIPIGTASGYTESMHERCGAKNAAYLECGSAFSDGQTLEQKTACDAQHAQAQIGTSTDTQTLKVFFNGIEHTFGSVEQLQLKGEHNYANALAAVSVCVALKEANLNANSASASFSSMLTDSAVALALKTFKPLEHRIEPCGEVCGVQFFNDSKATNVDATLVALKSFPAKKLVVLLGGTDKGTALDALVECASAQAHHVVCYGEAGPRFAKAFNDAGHGNMVLEAKHLRDAFEQARSVACAGDVILLSPACASFDEFNSFEHRGVYFKELVGKITTNR